MSAFPDALHDLLACPQCHGTLRAGTIGGSQPALVCAHCALAYVIEEGIPVLLAERALPLDDEATG